MDIGLYCNPVDFKNPRDGSVYGKHTLGFQIERDTMKYPRAKKGEIRAAILGVPCESGTLNKGSREAPAAVREELYKLANLEGRVIDLGDLKPGKTDADIQFALRDVTEYLREEGIVAIVLGGGQDLSIGISRAFSNDAEFVLTVADAAVDVKTGREVTGASNFISRIVRENPRIFHLQMMGIQSHLVPPAVLAFLRQQTYDWMTLGQLRDDFPMAEPLLRNTTFLSFDISAVRQSDAGSQYHPSPNGLFGEEACRIARYAGLSNRLKVFGLFEVNPGSDPGGSSSALAAQMVWYFLEALSHRRPEDPGTDKSPFKKYFVEMVDHGEPMVFYHHALTDRWWIEIFTGEGDSMTVPCREKDYSLAVKQEIPDIWWKYARKSERLSK